MNEKIAAALAEVGFEDDPKIRHAYPSSSAAVCCSAIMLASP
jgi:hypothetical protein